MFDCTCNENLKQIQDEVRLLKLDDSLLYLNHVLGVSRNFTTDPTLEKAIKDAKALIPPHLVHFIGKQLLLNASNLGHKTLDWDKFCSICDLALNLDDPIQFDPEWNNKDPSGFFERLLAQQSGPQYRNVCQKYGIALGLFRDVGLIENPIKFDLRSAIETELGSDIEKFMQIGWISFALRAAKHENNPCIGTFTSMHFVEAFAAGIKVCVPEVWTPFLNRVSCTPDEFRKIAARPEYEVNTSDFEQFNFNPLWRYPIIRLGNDRHLAVDPELVLDRVTLGLFYDLFEREQTDFSTRFGYAFEKYVGQLIGSVIASEKLWSAAASKKLKGLSNQKTGKVCDWAVVGNEHTVLIECKSLRASLRLRTMGDDESMKDLIKRTASAVQQLTVHSESILNGEWHGDGLPKSSVVGVVITYGRLSTLNGPMVRRRVQRALEDDGITPIKYVVLSIDELDNVVRIVEQGHSFDSIIGNLTAQENFRPLNLYQNELTQCAISSMTMAKAKDFFDATISRNNQSPYE